MMKKLYTMMAAVALLAACTGEKKSDVAQDPAATTLQPVADNAADSASTAVTEEVDGVTAATNVANRPTFNGLLMVSPQQQATLSLTMGGKVNSLHVMPGQAIGYGQVVATIDNPEYIELQLDYLDAAAQLEYLEKEYSRQRTLGDQDAASQKKVQQSKAEYLSMKARF